MNGWLIAFLVFATAVFLFNFFFGDPPKDQGY